MTSRKLTDKPHPDAFLTDKGWEIKNGKGHNELLVALKNRSGEPVEVTEEVSVGKEVKEVQTVGVVELDETVETTPAVTEDLSILGSLFGGKNDG